MSKMRTARGAAAERGGHGSSRPASVAAVALSVVLLAVQASAAGGKKPVEFSKGIQAQDQEQWAASEKLMRAALDKGPEDGQPARIYGTRYEYYLPHYYLGLALYKQGKCAAALEQWEACLKIGAVQRTPELSALTGHRIECQRLVLNQPKP